MCVDICAWVCRNELLVQSYFSFLQQRNEYYMALAEKYLIAWIRGFRARVMFREMKAEHVCMRVGGIVAIVVVIIAIVSLSLLCFFIYHH